MRVCLVSGLYPLRNGVPEYTSGLMTGLANSMREDEIFVLANKTAKSVTQPPKNVRILNVWEERPRYILQILRKVLEIRPQIVHIHHEFTLFGSSLSSILFPILLGSMKLCKIKCVVTFNGIIPNTRIDGNFSQNFFLSHNRRVLKVGLYVTTLIATHLTNRIIVHSRWQGILLEKYFRISSSRISVVPHGTELHARKSDDKKTGKRVSAVYFGFIAPSKGLENLIKAFESVKSKDLDLTIIGGRHRRGAEYYDSIFKLCDSSPKRDRIWMKGYIETMDLHHLLGEADFAVFPYISTISVSGALSIAIGHGLPVIATTVVVNSNYLEPGVNCVEVHPENVEELSNALERLTTDGMYRMHLATGMKELSAMRSWDRVGAIIGQIYRDSIS